MLTSLAIALLLQPTQPTSVATSAARLRVECPAGVDLFIDNTRSRASGPLRYFHTPPLPPGRFTYQVRWLEAAEELARVRVEVAAGAETHVPCPPAVARQRRRNFGLDLSAWQPAARVTLNGEPITEAAALRLLDAAPMRVADLPTDGERLRLTLIGPESACRAVKAELAGPLAEFTRDFVVKRYDPSDWAVRLAGFVTSGEPTIYAQAADGRVLFRQDDPSDLRLNLEALRAPRPDYQPERDPDYRQRPPAPVPAVELPPFAWLCLLAAAALLGFALRR